MLWPLLHFPVLADPQSKPSDADHVSVIQNSCWLNHSPPKWGIGLVAEEEQKQTSSPQRPFCCPVFCVSGDGFGSVQQRITQFPAGFRMMSFGYILSTCRMLASNSHGLGLLTTGPQVTLLRGAKTASPLPPPKLGTPVGSPEVFQWGNRNRCEKFHKDTRGRTKVLAGHRFKEINLQVSPGDPIFGSHCGLRGKFWFY